ncbi:MAG: UxaA family hydrolase, partial [Spirochaetales bacterium]|nr:UxaA family hydrolase [Candidatus Physcosoma equi]
MDNKLIKINSLDNVVVAIEPIAKGEVLNFEGEALTILSDVPRGHKIALCDIKKDEEVIKYGYPIGAAKEDIKRGQHVHAFNIHTLLAEGGEYYYNEQTAKDALLKHEEEKKKWAQVPSIMAYERKNGEIGIRNGLWIVPTVGCVNRVAERLKAWGNANLGLEDGVHAWTHPFGCSQLGDDHENTRRILSGLVHHPNAGGVL